MAAKLVSLDFKFKQGTITVSLEEAEEFYEALRKLFDKPVIKIVDRDHWYPWHVPNYWEQQTWLKGTPADEPWQLGPLITCNSESE